MANVDSGWIEALSAAGVLVVSLIGVAVAKIKSDAKQSATNEDHSRRLTDVECELKENRKLATRFEVVSSELRETRHDVKGFSAKLDSITEILLRRGSS